MCKLSFFQLEGLPDEILLNTFSWLDTKGVLQCGQVSRRLRAISNDKLLWLKLNLFQRDVPYGFIEKAVQNGCEYLNLGFSCVHGGRGKKSKVPWKLRNISVLWSSVMGSGSTQRSAWKLPSATKIVSRIFDSQLRWNWTNLSKWGSLEDLESWRMQNRLSLPNYIASEVINKMWTINWAEYK